MLCPTPLANPCFILKTYVCLSLPGSFLSALPPTHGGEGFEPPPRYRPGGWWPLATLRQVAGSPRPVGRAALCPQRGPPSRGDLMHSPVDSGACGCSAARRRWPDASFLVLWPCMFACMFAVVCMGRDCVARDGDGLVGRGEGGGDPTCDRVGLALLRVQSVGGSWVFQRSIRPSPEPDRTDRVADPDVGSCAHPPTHGEVCVLPD